MYGTDQEKRRIIPICAQKLRADLQEHGVTRTEPNVADLLLNATPPAMYCDDRGAVHRTKVGFSDGLSDHRGTTGYHRFTKPALRLSNR